MVKPTEMVRLIARHYGGPGDVAVDATAGNGGDTLFLARLVDAGGPGGGRVYAFDLQEEALAMTRTRLSKEGYEEGESLRLILDNHAHMTDHVKESLSVILFNLGYLPGGDHSLATKADTTIPALIKALSLLRPGGLLSLMIYSGGDSGFEERDRVLAWLKDLDAQRYVVLVEAFYNRPNNPPLPVFVRKLF